MRREVDRNGSRQCPTLEFCISGVEPSDSATKKCQLITTIAFSKTGCECRRWNELA